MEKDKDKVVELKGDVPGPTSIIMAGVHGDERCGIEAFRNLLPNLNIERGRVLFIYGNPRAIEADVRSTEANLNRLFKPVGQLSTQERTSYEYERAQVLKGYLEQSDVLLDIHASTNPRSQRFLICESNAEPITKSLPFNLIVSGFDKVEPGGTDYYMNSIGKAGICVECGYARDPSSTQVAEEAILTFLKARGHISGEVVPQPQTRVEVHQMYLTESNNFVLARNFADFEEIKAGELIGTDGGKEIRATEDGFPLFPHNRNQVGSEAFLLGRKLK